MKQPIGMQQKMNKKWPNVNLIEIRGQTKSHLIKALGPIIGKEKNQKFQITIKVLVLLFFLQKHLSFLAFE